MDQKFSVLKVIQTLNHELISSPKNLAITVSVEVLNDSCFRFEFRSLLYSVLHFKLISLGGEMHFLLRAVRTLRSLISIGSRQMLLEDAVRKRSNSKLKICWICMTVLAIGSLHSQQRTTLT